MKIARLFYYGIFDWEDADFLEFEERRNAGYYKIIIPFSKIDFIEENYRSISIFMSNGREIIIQGLRPDDETLHSNDTRQYKSEILRILLERISAQTQTQQLEKLIDLMLCETINKKFNTEEDDGNQKYNCSITRRRND